MFAALRDDATDLFLLLMNGLVNIVQRELQRTVWAATGKSWYKTDDGRITNNWSGSTIRYWWEARHADLSLYHQKARARAAERIARPLETAAHNAAD